MRNVSLGMPLARSNFSDSALDMSPKYQLCVCVEREEEIKRGSDKHTVDHVELYVYRSLGILT